MIVVFNKANKFCIIAVIRPPDIFLKFSVE